MTTLQLTVVARSTQFETDWVRRLQACLGQLSETIRIAGGAESGEWGQLVFLDAKLPALDSRLETIDRKGRAIFLIVEDGEDVPAAFEDGRVDDVLVAPFRSLEVLGKLKHYQHILMWDEVARMNASFSELIDGLRDDLQLAERLQKSRLPLRFPDIKGFKVASRYLAGIRSGGDYMDLAESQDGSQLSIVMSDSSSYGLSSAVLTALMRLTVKLSVEETRSVQETVRRIYEELTLTLGEKDRLSMFYGIVSRKDYSLRYLNFGDCSAFHAPKGEGFRVLESQGGAMSQASKYSIGRSQIPEARMTLSPEDRLIVLSDGFVEIAGGKESAVQLLNQFRTKEPVDLLNEFVFKVKSGFKDPDDMPAQDCTAMIFDVDSKVLRLAR